MRKSIFKCVLATLISIFVALPAMADITLETRDMDGTPTSEWRRIAFQLTNNGAYDTNMSKLSLEYLFAETSVDGMHYSIWNYTVHSADWSVQNRVDNEAHVAFTAGDDGASMIMTFDDRTLPANGGQAVIEMGFHFDGYTPVDESNDPSWNPSNTYVENPLVVLEGDVPVGCEGPLYFADPELEFTVRGFRNGFGDGIDWMSVPELYYEDVEIMPVLSTGDGAPFGHGCL